ncbi:hypothetical protein [Myroides odoratus]|uniref:Uncharacterized protein n=1 Tax=Myroides odoratus TaxID=256 RepID=A0A9Q6Z8F0_MYROD|nr:hypothetical protein [Myroides odoratus]EHQ42598.1 hypothetical protein Myrod_1765 [Myroides odoratus DSM 2801]EKB07979.1 hypothetical protein HMPREF9716_01621 [Myroides odoratus CIP 103059]QQT99967.1 hypothetical protein I6I88_17675 [Myroides odoratus]WQD57816.1 hypothetical protein U0010_01275 [Myroides odoratus]STZ29860.1 Uncharacterised protein [Myroides odoratus]
MRTKNKDWLVEFFLIFPELPGILLLLIGLLIRYAAIKGNAWTYDTGGPGIFSNITWIKNTFGEAVAQRLNLFIAWGIILMGIALISLGVWLRIASMNSK